MTIFNKTFVKTESPAVIEKKQKYKALNIFMAGLIFCSILFIIASPVSFYIVPVLLILNHVVLPLLFEYHIRTGKWKTALITVRSAVIVLFAAIYAFPIICIGFNNAKSMYSAKKFVFSTEKCYNFPDKLPDNCNDYVFRTEPQAIAQDYHRCAYLAFRTDADTMKQMENDIIAKGGVVNDYSLSLEEFFQEKLSHTPENEKKYLGEPYNQMPLYMEQKGLPIYVYNWIENINMNGSLGNASVYKNKGCLFNYETGLVVFWT